MTPRPPSALLRAVAAFLVLPGGFLLLDRFGTTFGRDAAGLAASLAGLFAAFALGAAAWQRSGRNPAVSTAQLALNVLFTALGLAASWYLAGLMVPHSGGAAQDVAFWARFIGRATAAAVPFALCSAGLLVAAMPTVTPDKRPTAFDAVLGALGGYAVTAIAIVLGTLVAFHGTGAGHEPLLVAGVLGLAVAALPFVPAATTRGLLPWWLAAATALVLAFALARMPAALVPWSVLLFAPAAVVLLARASPWSWLGAAAAAPLAGAVLLPRLDHTTALYGHIGLLAVLFVVAAVIRRAKLSTLAAGVLSLALLAFLPAGDLASFPARDGWRTVERRADLAGAVVLIERLPKPGEPLRQRLVVDRRYTAGGALGFGERRLGHIPLLLHPAASNVLFLGVDSGVAPGAARTHGTLQQIDAIEPVAALSRLLPRFGHVNEQFYEDPRVRIRGGDVLRALRTTAGAYDVIVALPALAGRRDAAAQFDGLLPAAAAKRLAPGGLYVQWLALDGLEEPQLRRFIAAHLATFPDAWACAGTLNADLPILGLVGRASGAKPAPVGAIDAELRLNPGAAAYVASPADLAACAVVDAAGLRALAGDASPRGGLLERLRWKPVAGRGAGLLATVLAQPPAAAANVVDFGAAPGTNVAARAASMRSYLTGDIGRIRGSDTETIDGYLRAYAADPAFAPARAMLLLLASQKTNQTAVILKGMVEATPQDPALRRMFSESVREMGLRAGVPMPPGPGPRPPAPPVNRTGAP